MTSLTKYIFMPLTFIGALNWGLIGLFGINLVTILFGSNDLVAGIVYSVIGLAAFCWLIMLFVDRPIFR